MLLRHQKKNKVTSQVIYLHESDNLEGKKQFHEKFNLYSSLKKNFFE